MATRAWLPTDATSATLVGWFDAQDASSLTVESGGGVSAWRSKVGGWSVAQASAANQPPYSPYNNLPAVFPTTDSQFLSGAAPSTLPTGGDAGSMTGVGTVIAYRNTYSTMFYWGSANQNKARSIAATGNAVSSGYYGNDVQGNVAWPGFTRLFISSISATGYAEQWVDGGPVQAAQKNVLSTPTTSTFWLGRSINGDPWKNPIQEICLWKGTLSATDRAKLEGYYAWRWNLAGQLPASHPYKAAAPVIDDAGTAGATGAAAVTLGGVAGISTASLPIAGTTALSLSPISSSPAASLAIVGQAVTPIAAVTMAGSGSLPVAGGALLSPGAIGTISTARVAVTATAETVIGPMAAIGVAGSVQLSTAQIAIALAPVITAASGAARVAGLVLASLDTIAVVGGGRLTASAEVAVRPSGISVGAIGSTPCVARAAAQLGPVATVAAGSLSIAGGASPVFGVLTIAAETSGDASRPAGPAIILPHHRFVVPARQRRFSVPRRPRAFLIRKGTSMSSITKYPAEERQYQADWTPDLAGQTIVGTIAATSADPTLIVDRVTYDGPIMKFWLHGGTSGRAAAIRFIASTSGGEDLAWQQTVVVY